MHKCLPRLTGDGLMAISIVAMSVFVLGDAYRQGERSLIGSQLCNQKSLSYEQVPPILSSFIVHELEVKGYVVIDNVLSQSQIGQIQKDLFSLNDNNDPSDTQTQSNSIDVMRSDTTTYISQQNRDQVASKKDTEGSGLGLLHAQNILRGVGSSLLLNKFAGFLGVASDHHLYASHLSVIDDVQLALYKGTGTACEAHRDGISETFRELGILQWLKLKCCRVRVVTAILYLNPSTPEWLDSRDGGSLRLFLGADRSDNVGGTAVSVVDISPIGGRLVIFDSQTVLHEVLMMKTSRNRHAITVFFSL
jgi:hypothetical protein